METHSSDVEALAYGRSEGVLLALRLLGNLCSLMGNGTGRTSSKASSAAGLGS